MTLPSSCSLTVSDAVVHAAYHNDEDAMKVFEFLGSQPDALSTLAPSAAPSELTKRIVDFICDDVLPSYGIASEVGRSDVELPTAVAEALGGQS